MQEIDEKKRPESLFLENYRFTIPIWGIAIWGSDRELLYFANETNGTTVMTEFV